MHKGAISNLLLLNMILRNRQLTIGLNIVKFKDLLRIEEAESFQSALSARRTSQMSNLTVFFLLQIPLEISTMSIK